MRTEEIMRHVDHTLLSQTAGWEEIRKLCCEALTIRRPCASRRLMYVRQKSIWEIKWMFARSSVSQMGTAPWK